MAYQKLDPQIARWVVIVAIEAVVAILLAVIVIIPQINSINEAQAALEAKQKILTDLKNKSDLLANFSFEFAQKDSLINQIMPSTKDVGLVLSSVRQVALNSGIDIVGYDLNPGEIMNTTVAPGQAGTTPSFVMNLTIKSTPANVQKFLSGVDESLPLKSVENLEVTRSVTVVDKDGQTSQNLEAKVTLRAFYTPVMSIKTPVGSLSPFSKDLEKTLATVTNFIRLENVQTTTSSATLGNSNLFGL